MKNCPGELCTTLINLSEVKWEKEVTRVRKEVDVYPRVTSVSINVGIFVSA